ncbi:hypothetical protein HELRODRAFT_171931 [Helobdella robusta]|uniref:Uncharacterized protein n=1 Tax=Helobdella robusta TaxID=6412 RepID=T1F4V4_HELRO|nr:hypothetical protein HELRODRAFT_171931 [Helobdella robusta]ESO04926.1 hypothetical protein HELRODRAFT_171931 [Helobdella robusta]
MRKLLQIIRRGQLKFFGHIMRKEKMENLTTTGKIAGKTTMVKFDGVLRSFVSNNSIPTQAFEQLILVASNSGIRDKSLICYPLHAFSYILNHYQEKAQNSDEHLGSLVNLSRKLSTLIDNCQPSEEMLEILLKDEDRYNYWVKTQRIGMEYAEKLRNSKAR